MNEFTIFSCTLNLVHTINIKRIQGSDTPYYR